MKNLIINLIISLLLGLLVLFLIPNKLFNKYYIELISQKKIESGVVSYFYDLDNDGESEQIELKNTQNIGNSIYIKRNNKYLAYYNLAKDELIISKHLAFADVNKNGNDEIYFISAYKNAAYLNILEQDKNDKEDFKTQKILIDSFKYYNSVPDINNSNFEFTDNKDVIFNLTSGFTIQPRKLYSYNIETKEIKKSPLASINFSSFKLVKNDSSYNILVTGNIATGNTLSFDEWKNMKISTNPDTIILYNIGKKIAYEYGDFASYTMVFDKDLNFAFTPVEHYGWTKYTDSDILQINNKNYIVSLTISERDSAYIPVLEIIDFEGGIIKSRKLKNYTGKRNLNLLMTNPIGNVILIYNIKLEELILFNNNLEQINTISLNSEKNSLGFSNLDNDDIPEVVIMSSSRITIYENDFSSKTEFPLHYCGDDNKYIFEIFKKDNKSFINIEVGDTKFILHYHKNKFYYLKYPIYILIVVLWYLLILFILKINSRRLELEKKKLEKTVKERTIELNAKNKELEKANNTKDKFFSIIAHDLKSPFSTILGFSELLLENHKKYNEEKREKYLKLIYSSSKITFQLLENLLLWSLSQRGKIEFKLEKENLYLLSVEIIELLSQTATNKSITIKNEIYKDTIVNADKDMLTTIMRNLISNALKFTPRNGEITIKAHLTTNENKQNYTEISVKDNGVGIAKEKLSQLFMLSENVSTNGTEGEKGTGLGLALCKEFIGKHEGEIWVESTLDNGSAFIFTLPEK